MSTSRPRRTRVTGNPSEDVKNPVFAEMEVAVKQFLQRRYGASAVVDNRRKNEFFDFQVFLGTDTLQKLDVKADQYFVATGNVAWENRIETAQGETKDGWGRKELDYIFYADPDTYTGVLVNARRMRKLAMAGGGWREFRMQNPGYATAIGYALPLSRLREVGAIVWEGYLEQPYSNTATG